MAPNNTDYDTDIRVLVVEDHQNMRELAKFALNQLGFRKIDEAANGADALRKLEATGYGLILSDINMEPVNGQALLRAVRNDPAWKHIPFIMVTADNMSSSVHEAWNKGATHYLVKPFNPASLKRILDRVPKLRKRTK